MPNRDEVDRLSKRLEEIRSEVPVNEQFTQAAEQETPAEHEQAQGQGQQGVGDFAPSPQNNLDVPEHMREGVDGPHHADQMQQVDAAAQAEAEQARKDHEAQQGEATPETGQGEQDHGTIDHEPDID